MSSTTTDRGTGAGGLFGADAEPDPRRWLILGIVGVAQMMVVLDATVVNIALPSAQTALHFSNANRQWVITAYTLGFGALLLLGGRLSDLVGTRRMFIIGAVGFAVASAVGGAAQSFAMLAGARGIQGVFAAMLAPAALSLLTTTFTDPRERGTAFGVYGAIAGAGGAIGLLLGGVLTQALNWRWCLFVNLAFAAAAVFGAITIMESQERDPEVKIDVPGTIFVAVGVFALVFGFAEADTKGWHSAITIGSLIASVVLLTVFVVLQMRVRHPLLPLRVVLDRTRGGSFLAISFVAMAIGGMFLFITYYMQQTLGYSPIKTGLAFMPLAGMVVVASMLGETLLRRIGPRPLIILGGAVAAGGVALLTGIGVHTKYLGGLLPGLMLAGFGMGLVYACTMDMATYGAADEDAGVASAMVNTCQQIAQSVGTALLNTIVASSTSHYIHAHARLAPASLLGRAQVHGYVSALTIIVGMLAACAIVCGPVIRGGVPDLEGHVAAAA